MKKLQDFHTAIQEQSHLDPESGTIVNIHLVRRFYDDDGWMLGSKSAYFPAFRQKRWNHRDGVRYARVFLALSDNMAFALDGEEFMPRKGDELYLVKGLPFYDKVIDSRRCPATPDSDDFIEIVTGECPQSKKQGIAPKSNKRLVPFSARRFRKLSEAIQQQNYFDLEKGDIVPITFECVFVDDDERVLQTKSVYFPAFRQRRQDTQEGERKHADVLWALSGHLSYALDGERFRLEVADKISFNFGEDWEEVTAITIHSRGGGGLGVLVRFETESIED